MGEVTTIGLDLAKLVFQAHGADAAGHIVFRKALRRPKVLEFFGQPTPCVVALKSAEAQASAAIFRTRDLLCASAPSTSTPSVARSPSMGWC